MLSTVLLYPWLVKDHTTAAGRWRRCRGSESPEIPGLSASHVFRVLIPASKLGVDRGAGETGFELRPLGRAEERSGGFDQRLEQLPVGPPVGPKPGRGLEHRALEHDRCPVVHGMRERRGRMDELEAMIGQRQGAQKRRREGERMDGGARVVYEPGQRQLSGATASAERLRTLQHAYAVARPRRDDRGGEAVRSGSDDDRGLRQSRGRAAPGA